MNSVLVKLQIEFDHEEWSDPFCIYVFVTVDSTLEHSFLKWL